MESLERVSLKSGITITGRRLEKVLEFRGVPYAAPPIGALRFAPPQPIKTRDRVFDATCDGPIPPQPPSRVDAIMGAITAPQSEDCLTLSIWTPLHHDNKLPILVWLHGGGFTSGAGSLPWYDGGNLASRFKVIVIGVNYRLGALGYLSIPGHLPGNLAILDQEAALRWVQENIEAFGGDPRQVTAVGQSGGGHTIVSLLSMETTEGLFQRAILQSPPLGIGLSTQEETQRTAEIFLEELGLDLNKSDVVEQLRDISTQRLLVAQSAAAIKVSNMNCGNLRPVFRPTELHPHCFASNSFIDRASENAVRRGIDILIGWTRDEAKLFFALAENNSSMTSESLGAIAKVMVGEESKSVLKEIYSRRAESSPAEWFVDLVGDVCFRLPSIEMAEKLMRLGGRVFVYQFDWEPSGSPLGACHCLDLPFVFGNWAAWGDAGMLADAEKQDLQAVSEFIMKNWVDFAVKGEPAVTAWQESKRPIMHIDTKPWIEQT